MDMLYLTAEHFSGGVPFCPEVGVISCSTVLQSSYSGIMGAPIALLGGIWFLVAVVLVWHSSRRAEQEGLRIFRNVWFLFGMGALMYSFGGQLLIGKICPYCDLADVLIALMIGSILLGEFKARRAVHGAGRDIPKKEKAYEIDRTNDWRASLKKKVQAEVQSRREI